jgi:Spy/CpxP family protein refolding chaperone
MKINCIKKAAMFLAVLTFSCAVVFAEPPPPCPVPPPPDSNLPVCEGKGPDAARAPLDAPMFVQELSEKLNLTDAQKTAIELIVANEAKEIQEIRENSKKQIDAILTPEQQKEFAEIKSEARQRMREHAGDRLEMLAEKLNLTEAQTAAIKPIFAAEANDIKTVWQDNSLSKEQKQSKMFDIRKAANEKINTILTPEQQAKFAELKELAERMMHRKEMGPGPGHRPFEQLPPPPPPEKQGPADSNS